ncbi:MAG: flagellar motor switch protein FliG [Planctomycetota bacterium]
MADGFTARQKVAALLLALEPGLSSKVLRNLGEDEVELVAKSMKELEELSVSENDLRDIYKEAVLRFRNAGLALGDVEALTRSVLSKAFGEQKGEQILTGVEQQTVAQRPFAVFEQVPSEDLANMLADEHPQIRAVFLAHLDAAKSGEILGFLPDEEKSDAIYRIATLGRSSPEVVQRVVEVIKAKIRSFGLSAGRSEPGAWVKKAATIINYMAGASDKSVLDGVSGRDRGIAEAIREEMFTFDDLAHLDKKSMQKVLGSIDTAVLALALKACAPGSEQNIFDNLSKRAREMVIDERDSKGPVPLSEVLEAQKQILTVVRDLIEAGEIVPAGGGEQLV